MSLFDRHPGYESSEHDDRYYPMSNWFAGEGGTAAALSFASEALSSARESSERREADAGKRMSAEILDWLDHNGQDWNCNWRRCRMSTVRYSMDIGVTGAYILAPFEANQQSFDTLPDEEKRGLHRP